MHRIALLAALAVPLLATAQGVCPKGYQPYANRCVTQRMADYISCIEASGGNKQAISDELTQIGGNKTEGSVSASGGNAVVKGTGALTLDKRSESALVKKLEAKWFAGGMSECAKALNPQSTKPPEASLAVEYARLFGAIEVPILVQIQSTGEPTCNDHMCNIRHEYSDPPARDVGYSVQTGHVAPELVKFWKTRWPYRDALVVSTDLWKRVAKDGMYGVQALRKADPKLGQCIHMLLAPWEYKRSNYEPLACTKEDTKSVGYLFLVIRNTSGKHLSDVAISYQDIPEPTPVADYLQSLDTDTRVIGARQKTIAGLKPGQTALLLLTVYAEDGRGFEQKFLDSGILPREVAFKIEGRAQAMLIRSPRREKALVASLPFGWYLQ